MLQSHHTLGPVRAVPGLFWTKSYVHPQGAYGSRAAPYEFCLPVRARRVLCMHYKLTGPVRVRDRKQPMNSPCGDRRGPVGPHTTPGRFFFANSGFVNSLTCPWGCHRAHLRVPRGPRTDPVGYTDHCRIPCEARTSITRGPCGVMRISWSTVVSSRTVVSSCTRLMWLWEQRRRKIPMGASLGLTQEIGLQKSYGARCDHRIY